MGGPSNVQTDFRGGEWSQSAQGRMDDKEYHRALNVCQNAYPTEAGYWTRRQGTRWLAYTYKGGVSWLIAFAFSQNSPYEMELTDSLIRFYSGFTLVMTNDPQVCTVDTSNPCVVTTAGASGWSTGDEVQFLFGAGVDTSACGVIMNRQFTITTASSTTFTLVDSVTGETVDGSTFTVPAGTSIGRILHLASPYTASQLTSVRSVQCELYSANVLYGNVVLLCPGVTPRTVANTSLQTSGAFAQFGISAISFIDGPYFDPPTNGSTITSSATGTGSKTLTASTATFASTDVGRQIRLFSEPAAWASGTAYTAGNAVKYTDGNYYTATTASTGKQPDAYPTYWSLTPAAAQWAWATITAYTDSTHVTATVYALDPQGNGLLYTVAMPTYRLGLYSATTGYPTNGVFHEGRLWLTGAQPNRFDGSNSNAPFTFSPTAYDGTVGDANSIAYIFNSDDVNPILWMSTEANGIICGTAGGEWAIQSSNLSDPLTPTSIQAHRVTRYKCANIPPAKPPLSMVFVQAQQKRVMEFTADVFSQKYLARNLSEKSQHISDGVAQLAYQQDVTPTVWARLNDGSVKGITYKRESSFTSEPPTMSAWHKHPFGLPGAFVESIARGPNIDGTLDTLYMSVLDPRTGFRHIECLTDQFLETNTMAQAWFLDSALPATAVTTSSTGAVIYGYTPFIGQTLTVWCGGLDLGDYTVAADGSITLVYGTPAAFTAAFLQSFLSAPTSKWDTLIRLATTVSYPGNGVQSYISAATSEQQHAALQSHTANQVYVFSGTSAATDTISVFNRTTGAKLSEIAGTALLTSNLPYYATANRLTYPVALDPLGNIYFNSQGGNRAVIRKFNIATQKIVGSFGIPGSGFTADATHMFSPGDMAIGQVGTRNALCLAASIASTGVALMDADQMKFADAQTITEAHQNVCTGFVFSNSTPGASYCNFHVLGYSNSVSSAAISLYTYKAAESGTGIGGAISTVGSLLPAGVDATWSHFSAVYGPIYDQTDGNVIILVKTTDSVTNKSYVVKLSTVDASVVWATPIGNVLNNLNLFSSFNIVTNSLSFFETTNTICTVNTTSGAVTETTITGTYQTYDQFLDGYDGSVFAYGSYTPGGGAPAPLNGTTSFTSKWFKFQDATVTQPVTALYNLPSIPIIAGYNYTSRGQRLRPVEPQESGTKEGPAFAHERRNQRAGFYLVNAQQIWIGCKFDATMRTMVLTTNSLENAVPLTQMFTGIARSEIYDDPSFDGMIAWQITRPYPCTVSAVGGFLHTPDI